MSRIHYAIPVRIGNPVGNFFSSLLRFYKKVTKYFFQKGVIALNLLPTPLPIHNNRVAHFNAIDKPGE